MSLTFPAQQPVSHLNRVATWIVAVVALALIAVTVAVTTARLVDTGTSATLTPVAWTPPAGTTLAGLRAEFTGRAAAEVPPLVVLAGTSVPTVFGDTSLADLREAFHSPSVAVPLAVVVPAPPVGSPTLAELRATFLGAGAPDFATVTMLATPNPWVHYGAEL